MRIDNLLTLDLGIRTGWVHILKDGLDTGVEELGAKRGETNGTRFLRFEAFLERRIALGVQMVAYEQVLTVHKSVAQASMAHGLVAVLEKAAAHHGIELASVAVGTLKKFATDDGRAKKPTMIRILIDRFPWIQSKLKLVKPTAAWKRQHTYLSKPARKAVWVKSRRSETVICMKHSKKSTADCACPGAAGFKARFGFSPYGEPKQSGLCDVLVADLEAVTFKGLIPDDNQVDAAWVAVWACEAYRVSGPFGGVV